VRFRWSVFNKPIAHAVPEWNPGAAPYAFSIAIFVMGFTAAFGGSWYDKMNPIGSLLVSLCRLEKVGPTSRDLFCCLSVVGTALGLAAFAIGISGFDFSFGFGVVGGIGLGKAYVSPVS